MNRKTTYLLLAVLLVLAGWWWGQRRFQARQIARESVRQPLAENFQPDEVNVIEITPGKNRGQIRAWRQNGVWMMPGNPPLPADPIAVDRLYGAIRRATINRVAALSRDNLDQFGLNENDRATVRLLDGESTRYEFWLGESSDDFLAAYLTRDRDPKVYWVEGFTREDIAREWRNLTVLQFDREQATQIAYAQKRGGFTLSRDAGGAWTMDGRPTQPEAVKTLVRELSSLRADDISAAHATFTPAGLTIEVSTPSGTQALIIGPPHPSGGILVKTTTDYVYTLSKTATEQILPARRALLK